MFLISADQIENIRVLKYTEHFGKSRTQKSSVYFKTLMFLISSSQKLHCKTIMFFLIQLSKPQSGGCVPRVQHLCFQHHTRRTYTATENCLSRQRCIFFKHCQSWKIGPSYGYIENFSYGLQDDSTCMHQRCNISFQSPFARGISLEQRSVRKLYRNLENTSQPNPDSGSSQDLRQKSTPWMLLPETGMVF